MGNPHYSYTGLPLDKHTSKCKGKAVPVHAMKAGGGGRKDTAATDGGERSASRTGPFTPGKKFWCT
jgi:hypothetical protein